MPKTVVPGSQIADGALGVDLQVDVTNTLLVGNGGTGAATLLINALLMGNGTGALQTLAGTSVGQLPTWNGTTWTAVTPTGGAGRTFAFFAG